MVFFQGPREPIRKLVTVPGLTDVAHVDALDGYGLLSGVSYASAPQAASNYKVNSLEMQANTFPLDALEVMDPLLGLKRAKLHTRRLQVGHIRWAGRMFICVARQVHCRMTTMWAMQADVLQATRGAKDTLRIYKEFYMSIPVEFDPLPAHDAVRGVHE